MSNTELWHNLPEWKVGWVAGFFDGEGTIGIYAQKKRTQLQVKVNSTCFEAIDLLVWVTQMGRACDVSIRDPRWKPQRVWTLTNAVDIYTFLSKIAPFLFIKKPQAELMLEYCRGKMTGKPLHSDDYYYAETKQLNKRRGKEEG